MSSYWLSYQDHDGHLSNFSSSLLQKPSRSCMKVVSCVCAIKNHEMQHGITSNQFNLQFGQTVCLFISCTCTLMPKFNSKPSESYSANSQYECLWTTLTTLSHFCVTVSYGSAHSCSSCPSQCCVVMLRIIHSAPYSKGVCETNGSHLQHLILCLSSSFPQVQTQL